MRVSNMVRSVALGGALLAAAGCGVDIDISGPAKVAGGKTAQFEVKVTNISACPLVDELDGGDFAFLPFIPETFLNSSPQLQFLCQLNGTLPAFSASTGLTASAQQAVGDVRAQVLQMAASGAAAATTCSGSGVVCEPASDPPFSAAVCELPALGTGNMTSLTCSGTVPSTAGGKVYSLAFADLAAVGVCKAGVNQSQACDSDNDCGGMAGACGSGICQGGGNAGNGCSSSGDCPDGTCVDCNEQVGLGVACFESVAASSAPAPAAGPWALTAGVILLSGLGALRLRRRSS